MKYSRKRMKLDDYFEGKELEIIKKELQEISEEENTYTLEEAIEYMDMPQNEKEKMIQDINDQEEKIKRKYIEKCKKVINNYYLRKKYKDSKQYIR